jgi:cysteine desulfurase/selenocysteine lyase
VSGRADEAAFDAARVRADFPALEQPIDGKRLVYLDNACTALKSRAVADRLHEFYLNWGGCGGRRSTHLASQAVEGWAQDARRTVADFVGAESPNEIVFTSGTTEAMNLVARAFPYGAGRREVIITDLEHNAVVLPFHEAARRGEIDLKVCPSRDGRLDLDRLESLLSDRTALVAVTRASNVYGGVQPLAQICRLAHRRGALVLSDYAQHFSSHRESLAETNVDFAAFSAHKLGGPFGVGALYGKENVLNRLGHYKLGGGAVKSVRWDGAALDVEYLDAPTRFEPGVPDLGGIIGFGAALRYLGGLAAASVREHVAGLTARAARALGEIPEIAVLGRPEDLAEGALVSFHPRGNDFSTADFNLYLNHELEGRFIAVRVGEHCAHLLHAALKIPATIRLSFFAYNTTEEVDAFVSALKDFLRISRS